MDVVIGIAMTSRDARLLLIEGSRGDGALIDHDAFDVSAPVGVDRPGFSEHVVSAVLGTYAAAAASGNTVTRVALTWTDAVAIEATLVIEALAEVGITHVAVAPTSDAVEAAAEHAVHNAEGNSLALGVVEPDVTLLAVVGAAGEDGTRRMRSRSLDRADEATTALALRGACDSFPERVATIVIAGSAPGLESLVEQINSVVSRPVTLSDDAALLLCRGALLATAHTEHAEPATPTTAVFIPRTARVAAASGVAEPETADPSQRKDPLVRALAMVVGAAALTLGVSAAIAFTGHDDDVAQTRAATPAERAEPLPPAEPAPVPLQPPALMALPAGAAPAPMAPPHPLIAAALSDPKINAVAQKVLPPAVHAAQTPITVPHTDITLPPLTQMIGK